MEKQPTIIDVARECGFSKSTVSLVLQGSSEIPPETATAVHKAIKKIGYRRNRFARGLRTRRSKMVGMLIQDHLNPFYGELVHHVEQRMREKGFDLVVISSNTDLKLEKLALERLVDQQVDGLIVSAMDYRKIARLLQSYEETGIHCVVAGPPARTIPFDCATVDMSDATCVAMEHLFGLGHRKIAFLWGAPAFQAIGARFDTFREMMSGRGFSVPEKWIAHCGFRMRDGYEAAHSLLCGKNRPTAIFALNDLLAVGTVAAAIDLGLRVPRDLSVMGVDNVEIASYTRPALTTISQPIEEYAHALSKLVLDGIEKKSAPCRVSLKAEFLVRGSTGPAA